MAQTDARFGISFPGIPGEKRDTKSDRERETNRDQALVPQETARMND
jgi:hypothetical protein